MGNLVNQAWKILVTVFVIKLDDQTTIAASNSRIIEGNSEVQNFVGGKIHFKPMVWDPTKTTTSVFNISNDSPLHIILSREKKGHCEMFFVKFTYLSMFKLNDSYRMIVCVAEMQKMHFKEKCYWVNDTEKLTVNQGKLYGMPLNCGPWYITVFVTDSTTNHSKTDELSVEVSEPYDPLAFRWFRVLTNIAFIPAIVISFKRGLYAECIVYFLNFTLSWVYHLCEAELHCFKGYERLHYSDMYASDLSIIVTLWAMTRIKEPLKHLIYLAIAIILEFATRETVDSEYHFFLDLVFGGFPACYLFYQYTFISIKYRSCFPSRKRWAFYLIPGFSLAGSGVLVNLIITEQENYYYVHCIWHLTIELSVAFLLPSNNEDDEWYRSEPEKSTYTPL